MNIGDWVISIGGGMTREGCGFQVTRIVEDDDGRDILHGLAPATWGHINNNSGGYPVELRTPYAEYRDRVWLAEFDDRGFLRPRV